MTRACLMCGRSYETTDKRRKFCAVACYHRWQTRHPNQGCFKKGNVPWLTGTKGAVKPNTGSFKPGHTRNGVCPIGTERTRKRQREPGKRVWIKVRDRRHPSDWILRAVYVWQAANGPLPRGAVVHHMNGNTLDDRLENLAMLTRGEHLSAHRPAFEAKRAIAAVLARWGHT